MQEVIGVIPARFGSTRLPGKMLAEINGKPLLWHTWSRAAQSKRLTKLVIAAGDDQILSTAAKFTCIVNGDEMRAEVVPVFDEVPSGSDRVWLAAKALMVSDASGGLPVTSHTKSPIILNIQGDEPQLEPELIDRVVERLIQDDEVGFATAGTPFASQAEWSNPACVKMLLDERDRVLVWTRAPVPYGWEARRNEGRHSEVVLRHIGVYAYRVEALKLFIQLPVGGLERLEKLEQLRLLAAGVKCSAARVVYSGMAVDTDEHLEAVRRAMSGDLH